jgi:diguanylate cyclase (GGDEF)-like protein
MKDLILFHELASALTSTLGRDEILRVILTQLTVYLKPESWCLLLVDEERNDLYYAVAHGSMEASLTNQRVPIGGGMAGWVAEHGETLIVPQIAADPRFHSSPNSPLRSRRRTIGVLQLFNLELEELSDNSITFLHILCDYAAIAIENTNALEKIQRLSVTDDLTGLYNARQLEPVLEQQVKHSRKSGKPFSLAFLDLDKFKSVNDEHGHLVGSRLLGAYGQRLHLLARSAEICFRYGGDEFLVVMPETGKQAAAERILTIREALRSEPFLIGHHSLYKTASFGIATFPEDANNINALLSKADASMYLVKHNGRDNVAVTGLAFPRSTSSL